MSQESKYSELIEKIVSNMETVIIGKRKVVELVVFSLISGGHVLIEDVPGVGKTSIVSSLAKSIDAGFSRIQFTPDVMPSDVTGFSIFNQKTREFEFRPGAVMSNIILADEINRASAKTQSSLLEAMEERQVTVDGTTYKMEEPFMVLATQNPLESFGTYPLPEAQIDRFIIKIAVGYPEFSEECEIVEKVRAAKRAIAPVADAAEILDLKDAATAVRVDSTVTAYMVQIVTATRAHKDVALGASPRGSIALHRMSQAYALGQGRDYCVPDDVKYLAPYILGHRITLSHEAKLEGITAATVIQDILDSVAVPI